MDARGGFLFCRFGGLSVSFSRLARRDRSLTTMIGEPLSSSSSVESSVKISTGGAFPFPFRSGRAAPFEARACVVATAPLPVTSAWFLGAAEPAPTLAVAFDDGLLDDEDAVAAGAQAPTVCTFRAAVESSCVCCFCVVCELEPGAAVDFFGTEVGRVDLARPGPAKLEAGIAEMTSISLSLSESGILHRVARKRDESRG